jgi:purine-binding chemotaxis protein CheW
MNDVDLHVLFDVGGSEYVLPAREVLQMESYSGATHVPGAPDYVTGLIQVRGRVLPVVDLRRRFGLPKAELGEDSRVVVVEKNGRTVALLVDRAREVVRIASDAFQPPPPVLAEQASGFVRAVAKTGDRLVMLVDSARVMGEETRNGE